MIEQDGRQGPLQCHPHDGAVLPETVDTPQAYLKPEIRRLKIHDLRTRARLPRPRPEVFAFFADAGNLQDITPLWLHFRILTPPPIEMKAGAVLDYRLRLHGIPLSWKTEITAWDPPHRFVDEQIRGPYRLWIHEHTFEEDGDGTVVSDHVRYAVPFGTLANWLLVRRDLRAIFQYREERLKECSESPCRYPGS
jgi:ligand-binding SRPBCC domain-containing protein